MIDIRKLVIVLLIAILFSVFVFSAIDAVYPSPDWSSFCEDYRPKAIMPGNEVACGEVPVPDTAYESCEGNIDYRYDANGCPTDYYCNTCSVEYDTANNAHKQVVFYISALLALIAIFVGLYLPAKKNTLNEWVGTGFLLGGAFVLLFGTVQSFDALNRWIKPLVMLIELLLVIFLAYKKVKNLK